MKPAVIKVTSAKVKGRIKKFFNNFFWRIYAMAYDDIVKYYKPYAKLSGSLISLISKYVTKGGRALDAGCGTGALSLLLAGRGYITYAGDVSGAMLDVLRKKMKKLGIAGINIKNMDMNKQFPYKNNFFNLITSVHALYMLEDVFFTLDQMDMKLKKGGVIIIAHPRVLQMRNAVASIFKNEQFFCALRTLVLLSRAAFFNLFLGAMHKKVYGEIKASKIVSFFTARGYRLLEKKKAYNGVDDLMILKKCEEKNHEY